LVTTLGAAIVMVGVVTGRIGDRGRQVDGGSDSKPDLAEGFVYLVLL
jgi:hypothetical protein